jgi:GNAT superfamily N-acetyltransferase
VIRRAEPEDMERIVEMGQRFVAETEYSERIAVRPERLLDTVINVATNPDGVIFVSGKDAVTGMIAMLAYDHPFSGERTAFEVVWWVDPEARGDGIRLLRAAESWAKEQGATKMQMVAPNQRVGALYERLGYAPIETSYQRSL